MSRIARVDVIQLAVPFQDGGSGTGMTPSAWRQLDMVLLRLEDTDGVAGWGEAFAYFCAGAVRSMLQETIVPLLLGAKADDPAALSRSLQQRLCLFGRYGVTLFALSGVDIALWDLAGKRRGLPVAALLGERQREAVPAYASLVRYGDAAVARRTIDRARAEGFTRIKLHEVERATIAACLPALGDARFMVDVNCNWSAAEADEMARWLATLPGLLWLEEPTFPPEDFAQLAQLAPLLPLGAGENLCTEWQFAAQFASGAVRYPQPSVTKVGGLTELARIMARAAGVPGAVLMPHSPYFGPGWLATLQALAALPADPAGVGPLAEYLYVEPEAWPYAAQPLPKGGVVAIPNGPGLGMDPDPLVLQRFRVA